MADNLTPEQRKKSMSAIKSKNTKAELALRKRLWSQGLRYRIHYNVEGRPDIAFPSKKIAVFVDGCFWHKCPDCFSCPKTNEAYWIPKLNRNVERAEEVNAVLEAEGWKVLRFYECRIKKDLEGVVNIISAEIKKKLF